MADFLSVKDWGKHQHYNDRKPPWIKLYNSLLDDYDFACLQDASKLLLIEIWMLASKCDNQIPNDPKWVKKQLPYDGKIDFTPLIDKGFLLLEQNASKTLADCKQNATRSVSVSALALNNKYWKEVSLEKEYMAFKKMRQQIKKPINDVAETRLVAKHKKLVSEGNDPAEIINLATERCWASFYPPKVESHEHRTGNSTSSKPVSTPQSRGREAAAEYFGTDDWETMAADG